jgi:UMF1 family MFS transporter
MIKNNANYKRTVFSWSIYDFANQPFTTIILTFVYSTFFVDFIAANPREGAVMWGRAITVSSIFIALISPIMGAIADKGGYRKFFLIFWTWICIIFSFLLYFPMQGEIFYALLYFCLANIGFEMGGIYLNAYPEILPILFLGAIPGRYALR